MPPRVLPGHGGIPGQVRGRRHGLRSASGHTRRRRSPGGFFLPPTWAEMFLDARQQTGCDGVTAFWGNPRGGNSLGNFTGRGVTASSRQASPDLLNRQQVNSLADRVRRSSRATRGSRSTTPRPTLPDSTRWRSGSPRSSATSSPGESSPPWRTSPGRSPDTSATTTRPLSPSNGPTENRSVAFRSTVQFDPRQSTSPLGS